MEDYRTMPKTWLRVVIYSLGMAVLALGIILNTKTTLGVTPIVAPAYAVADIYGLPFGDIVFGWYSFFLLLEVIIRQSMRPANAMKVLLKDLMQLPVCLLFTRCMNLFSAAIPTFEYDMAGTFWASYGGRFLLLLLAVILTGIGASMTLDMRLMPNPADGLVQAIADRWKMKMGNVKNAFDISNVVIAVIVGYTLSHHLIGIGVGTIVAALGIGRVIRIYHLALDSYRSSRRTAAEVKTDMPVREEVDENAE